MTLPTHDRFPLIRAQFLEGDRHGINERSRKFDEVPPNESRSTDEMAQVLYRCINITLSISRLMVPRLGRFETKGNYCFHQWHGHASCITNQC